MLLAGAVIFAMCASYFVIAIFFAWLFEMPFPTFSARGFPSIAIIGLCVGFAYVVAAFATNAELGNRFQHAFGGGFTAFLVCFLACRDTRLKINSLRFIVVAFLIVTAMGVGNELLEYVVQSHTNLVFSDNPMDTWRDLTSNTVGAFIAASMLFPRIVKQIQRTTV